MDPETARRWLRESRADILRRRERLAESFDDIVEAARDSNLDDEHDTEGTTIASERSMVSSLDREAADRVAAIDLALARVEAGTYGICLTCGEDVGEGRLEARPAAEQCIGCARRGGR